MNEHAPDSTQVGYSVSTIRPSCNKEPTSTVLAEHPTWLGHPLQVYVGKRGLQGAGKQRAPRRWLWSKWLLGYGSHQFSVVSSRRSVLSGQFSVFSGQFSVLEAEVVSHRV